MRLPADLAPSFSSPPFVTRSALVPSPAPSSAVSDFNASQREEKMLSRPSQQPSYKMFQPEPICSDLAKLLKGLETAGPRLALHGKETHATRSL